MRYRKKERYRQKSNTICECSQSALCFLNMSLTKPNTYYIVEVNGVTNDKVSVAFLRRNNLIFTWPDNIHCDTLVIHNIRLLENSLPSDCGTLDFSISSEILGRIK